MARSLRQFYREGKRVRKRTLANLTCLPSEAIEILKRALRGEQLVPADQAFAIERSIPHGHVKAILGTIRKLVENQELQLSLFDQQDLAEIRSDQFPGERLVACFNPLLADTSEPKKRLSAEDTVRSYKNLGQVEQVFRCFKGMDLRVRPIYLCGARLPVRRLSASVLAQAGTQTGRQVRRATPSRKTPSPRDCTPASSNFWACSQSPEAPPTPNLGRRKDLRVAYRRNFGIAAGRIADAYRPRKKRADENRAPPSARPLHRFRPNAEDESDRHHRHDAQDGTSALAGLAFQPAG